MLLKARGGPSCCLRLCCFISCNEIRDSNLLLNTFCSASPLIPRFLRLSLLYFGLLLELAISALFFNLQNTQIAQF